MCGVDEGFMSKALAGKLEGVSCATKKKPTRKGIRALCWLLSVYQACRLQTLIYATESMSLQSTQKKKEEWSGSTVRVWEKEREGKEKFLLTESFLSLCVCVSPKIFCVVQN